MPPRSSPKKQLLLSIGLDKPVSEIVAAAQAKGITVSRAYVELLKKGRSSGRPSSAAKKIAAPGSFATVGRRPATAPPTAMLTTGDIEEAYRQAAADLVLEGGLGRARAVLDEVVGRIRAAVSG
jgi:hypothetical protein